MTKSFRENIFKYILYAISIYLLLKFIEGFVEGFTAKKCESCGDCLTEDNIQSSFTTKDSDIVKEIESSENPKEKILSMGKKLLILVHAPWCGFCKDFLPKWEGLEEIFDESSPVTALKFSSEMHPKTTKALKVDSFPTIFKVRYGNMEIYEGERDPVLIEVWARI